MSMSLEECVVELHRVGGVKFGDFTLKSGMQSPFYVDLRIVISYPRLLENVAELLWAAKPNNGHQLVCGVAYTGLPIATVMSQKQNIPMVIRRKESKGYGTKKLVEGNYSEGDQCLVVEDVVVSGSSVYETAVTLLELGLKVEDAVVFLDREHGALANLAARGIKVFPVITITKMMSILLKHGCINQETHDSVLEFVSTTTNIPIPTANKDSDKNGVQLIDRKNSTFESRAATANHPLTRTLLELMSSKKTNLCVAVDVTSSQELLSLADKVGPHICLLKTHVDILQDFNLDCIEKLKALADKHNFLLFEDRKFGDIGNTVAQQYSGGSYSIVEWAHLVTVHGLPGDGVIKGLASAVNGRTRGCVLVSQMSSTGALTSEEYVKGCRKIAENHTDFVVGFVAQSSMSDDPQFILFTPGVQLDNTGDGLGQQYVTPRAAVLERSADVIIVGRGITRAKDPAAAAQTYKEAAFAAYKERAPQ